MKSRPTTKNDIRKRRHARVRARVVGSPLRPRLTVFKSNKFISVQVVDDAAGRTLAAAHGREFKGSIGAQAAKVGEAIAERAKAAGVSTVVFDRGGYQYAAQIRALADAARAGGLAF
jgi:large subunit ribosomal protein L18